MTGWLLVLSFLLGMSLTWLYMVRRVHSDVARGTISAPLPQPRSAADRYREQSARHDVGRPARVEPPRGGASAAD